MPSPPTDTATTTKHLTVALIGNPNTGKSTIFNALAGAQSRIANFPGVTVEKKVGHATWEGNAVQLVDLPGTYSLSPRTADEMVAVDVLLGQQAQIGHVDVVVCVVDAANLERNLYLVSQLLELGVPLVLALNMSDVAKARGMTIDVGELAQRVAIPIVRTVAHRKQGLDELKGAILRAAGNPPPAAPRPFPVEFYAECDRLFAQLHAATSDGIPSYLVERLILDVGGYVQSRCAATSAMDLSAQLADVRDRLARRGLGVPAIEAQMRYTWARQVLSGAVTRPVQSVPTASDRIDRVLTHRITGLIIFVGLMFVLFQAIYRWAVPFMEAIEAAQNVAASLVSSALAPGPLRSLLVNGVIAGVGSVVVFLPQIAFLFFFIAILEDCGYMARAAFLMDKLMSKIGLSGKSFVPLMSSFACAIPGVMATRVIEHPRDRMVTILIAPLMSCSARLPVYLLLIGAFVPPATYLAGWISLRGIVLFAVSSIGVCVAIPVAWLLRKTFFRGEAPPFVLELPTYKWPSPRVLWGRVYERSKAFVTRAGTLIFATTVLVWAVGYFPGDRRPLDRIESDLEQLKEPQSATLRQRRQELIEQQHQLTSQLMAQSFLGQAGKSIEPLVKPLGWDWRIGVGAIASFPAREVIIATLGTIYSLGGEVDDQDQGLVGAMQAATWPDGRKVYNVPVAFSIMVFFALCAQCGSTLIVIKRETNSWFWPAFTFVYMTALAYVGALLTYQLGMLIA
jgi:ferrous iron transport protein B